MISLELKSRKIQDILKYIYLCLGKDEVPLQELVFFIAYDLNLYAPSSCEKVITAGINAGLVSVSKAKIVTFHVDKLASGTGDHAEELPEPTSPVVLAGKLAASEKILDKAVSIKDGRIIEARIDAKRGIMSGKFSTESGNVIEVSIDAQAKKIHQDDDENVDDVKNKRVFLKYMIKLVLKHRNDSWLGTLLRDIVDDAKAWTFTYQEIR